MTAPASARRLLPRPGLATVACRKPLPRSRRDHRFPRAARAGGADADQIIVSRHLPHVPFARGSEIEIPDRALGARDPTHARCWRDGREERAAVHLNLIGGPGAAV